MKAFWQVFAIFAIAGVIGLGYNQVRSDGLPLKRALNDEAAGNGISSGIPAISIEEAVRLFKNNEAVFLDARSEEQYHEGHIPGAWSLPWENVEDQCFEVIDRLPWDKMIITYCDGVTCHLCDFLAIFLRDDMGYQRVRVLANGWSTWRRHNLPVESSEQSLPE